MNIDENYWTGRHTIRRYSDRSIPAALLEQMLLKASHAPTTGNMQLYSVVITTDPAEKKALAPAHFNQPQIEGAAAVLTFCTDLNRFTKWCLLRDADPGYDNLQSFMAAILDTISFAQQFNTIAEGEGLGVCWLGTTTYNAPEIAKALDLPRLTVPVITLTVGYPAEDGVDVGRLPVEAIIHHGKYHEYTPSLIDKYYQEKESRDDSAQFIAENGKQTLAQVFTDIRYPRTNNELFSEKFISYLRDAGFLK